MAAVPDITLINFTATNTFPVRPCSLFPASTFPCLSYTSVPVKPSVSSPAICIPAFSLLYTVPTLHIPCQTSIKDILRPCQPTWLPHVSSSCLSCTSVYILYLSPLSPVIPCRHTCKKSMSDGATKGVVSTMTPGLWIWMKVNKNDKAGTYITASALIALWIVKVCSGITSARLLPARDKKKKKRE